VPGTPLLALYVLHAFPATPVSASKVAPSKGTTITLLPWVSLPSSLALSTSMAAKVNALTCPFSMNTAARSSLYQWFTVPSV
jgi:hypothetical protein